jgi:hypothetical protein
MTVPARREAVQLLVARGALAAPGPCVAATAALDPRLSGAPRLQPMQRGVGHSGPRVRPTTSPVWIPAAVGLAQASRPAREQEACASALETGETAGLQGYAQAGAGTPRNGAGAGNTSGPCLDLRRYLLPLPQGDALEGVNDHGRVHQGRIGHRGRHVVAIAASDGRPGTSGSDIWCTAVHSER